jgi:hypothetical protein
MENPQKQSYLTQILQLKLRLVTAEEERMAPQI